MKIENSMKTYENSNYENIPENSFPWIAWRSCFGILFWLG